MSLRIAVIGPSPCDRCTAACCKQNGHEYAVLLRAEEYPRFAAYSQSIVVEVDRRRVGERVLPYVAGRCRFLGDDDRCLIYDDRPASCRGFECASAFNHRGSTVGAHGEFLKRNPSVRQMLELL